MGTSNLKKGFYVAAVIVCAIFLQTHAQEISKSDLEQRAGNNFAKQRYDKAASDYEILNSMFPKDTRYAYFLGRSYLQSNQNITRATELLKFAATRNYGEDAYFYLGKAYLLNYQFNDAKLAFTIFKNTASGKQLEKFNADYWLKVTDNSMQSATVAEVLYVENLQIIPVATLESAFRDNIEGKYIYVPDEFKSDADKETDFQSLMFIPSSSQNGDYLYFASRSKKDRTGLDIYRVQRLTAENYSLPELLPAAINTPYDDAFPYYDKATGTLYFSSMGHNTSGGYDVFKSHIDPSTSLWSKPEKMNFPLNTPYDDYLYTLTKEGKGAIFLTNRNSGMKDIEAYTIDLSQPVRYSSPISRDEMLTCALLSPSSIAVNQSDPGSNSELINPSVIPLGSSSKTLIYSPEEEYARLVQEALELQSKSDSLNWSSKEIRLLADGEQDYLKKQELLANLTTIEAESKRMQHLADEKFTQADRLRGNNTAVNKTNLTIQQPEVTRNTSITQYAFNNSTKAAEEQNSPEAYQQGVDAGTNASAEISSVFSISGTAPYSKENPIPVAILPAGLVYRIQLGSFTNPIPDNAFGGLSPVSKEKNTTETKYYVGYFPSIIKAREALEEVKKYGYPDAFIVSYYDSKKIPIQKAREIEFAEQR